PSPKPNCVGPLVQALSSKSIPRQAVPWLEPLSRYFQTAPVEISVSARNAGTADKNSASIHASEARRGRREAPRYGSAYAFSAVPFRQVFIIAGVGRLQCYRSVTDSTRKAIC